MAVLDGSFLIDLSRKDETAVQAMRTLTEHGHRLMVPAQAALEYLTGLDDPIEGMRDIETGFQFIPFGKSQVLKAAKLARQAFSSGRFPGWADACIATTAQLEQEIVVTANPDHFVALGCQVWDYRNQDFPTDAK